jgi:retinol dehydrogenase-10
LHNRNSPNRVRIYHVDVTRSTDVYACAERVRYDLGQVTILIANAGFVSGRTLLTESDSDIERTFGVNSLSPIWLIKAFLPYMLDANRGHVVFIASVLGIEIKIYLNKILFDCFFVFIGIHASHGPISYVSSKHASVGLSRSLRLDISATHPDSRVSVHCICPYLMRTKMFNPMVNRVSLKLLVPIVSPRYAATQVLDAIEWQRDEVILPYHLKYIGFIHDFILPKWLSQWFLFQVSGRQPLDAFIKDNEENHREKKRKHLHTVHKENIDLI